MRRYFPGFRWSDVGVLAAMLAIVTALSLRDPARQEWRDAALPTAGVAIYVLWSWRRQ